METTPEELHTIIIVNGTGFCNKKKGMLIMPTAQKTTYPEGVEIKVARIRAGLRQYDVAASVGILPNRLSEIEAGRRRPSPELLTRILQVIEGNGDTKARK